MQFRWAETISDRQWAHYRAAMDVMRRSGIRFLLGGGFALATYTGRWRNTKDIDFYICEDDCEAAIAALAGAGFEDYHTKMGYDRRWIYRAHQDGVIVDIIWAMANQRAHVDDRWFEAPPVVSVRGQSLRVVPIEEFIWCKLYILQRDHCDWTDVLNLLYAAGNRVDWDHLLSRLGEDWPVLKALLTLYGWLCPKRARELPESLRRRLRLDRPEAPRPGSRNRIRLLDSRNWFAALLPPEVPLEV